MIDEDFDNVEWKQKMTLTEISEILKAEFANEVEDVNKEIRMACGSDLMSDVLAFIKADSLLLTSLTNIQVVRTAEMADVAAICFLRGKEPKEDTIQLAAEKKIPILLTDLSMYESCGRLYRKGLPSCYETK